MRITVLVNEEEHARIKAAAGLIPLSAYLRNLALAALGAMETAAVVRRFDEPAGTRLPTPQKEGERGYHITEMPGGQPMHIFAPGPSVKFVDGKMVEIAEEEAIGWLAAQRTGQKEGVASMASLITDEDLREVFERALDDLPEDVRGVGAVPVGERSVGSRGSVGERVAAPGVVREPLAHRGNAKGKAKCERPVGEGIFCSGCGRKH